MNGKHRSGNTTEVPRTPRAIDWHINAAQLESMFEIVVVDSVVDVADCCEADVAGGRGGDERTLAEWRKSFSLLDGQVCDHSDTCVVTDRIGGCESATSALCRQYFFRSSIQQKIFPNYVVSTP